MVKVLMVLFVCGVAVGCKPVHRSETSEEVPKALFGTWILEDTGATKEVTLGDAVFTFVRRVHFKVEPSQVSYIVYCESEGSGTASALGVAPATITPDTIVFQKPEMKATASWCQADLEAPGPQPTRYSLVNDALHIMFRTEQGEKVLQHAR